MNKLIAHIREVDGKDQSLTDHLQETSKFAGQFAGKIGLQEIGEIIGLFHDLGKASNEFQNYIRSANGRIDPDADEYVDFNDKKGKVDHSSAGAQILYRDLCDKGAEGFITAQVLSLCIASHHSGLIDCLAPEGKDSFSHRMEKSEERTHVDEVLKKLSINEGKKNQYIRIEKDLIEKFNKLKEQNDSKETFTFKCGLLIRFLFSCLIDADRLSTADFESRNNMALRNYGHYQSWDTLIYRLNKRLDEFERKENKNEVDELRYKVSQSCLNFSSKPKGIYQLTVPTGGGKTLASLRFALNHAKIHDMERVFYIIPYTSIIDQNAEEVRKILEDKDQNGNYSGTVVLEHHSNLTPEEETYRQKLLAQNWDAPIVFTTQVQFLETLFGSRTRGARRMHQLANSVIIFDEIQTLPVRCVHLFNLAIRFLVHDCGSTVVLCTATQPLLDNIRPIQRALSINSDQKIISNTKALFEKLKRVEVNDRRKIGGWTDGEIADLVEDELKNEGSVLVIVNTKKSARTLFTMLKGRKIENLCHLSTNMCPVHRLEVLNSIKTRLIEKKPVVCVSTQLIEAGVDIDFGSVIRYLAGLDSIAQAAGRCNRNGERIKGNVWIVNPSIENIEKLKDIKVGVQVTERILDEYLDSSERFENNRIGLEAMEKYYQYYFYQRKDEMSFSVGKQSILGRDDNLFNLLSMNTLSVKEYERIENTPPSIPFKQSFQTASKLFRVIDSKTRGVIVPYGHEGQQTINQLCSTYEIEKQIRLIRRAQKYSVNLFIYEFERMAEKRGIFEVQEGAGIFYLDDQYYDEQFGWNEETVNEMKTQIC